jgi:putative membrane protein
MNPSSALRRPSLWIWILVAIYAAASLARIIPALPRMLGLVTVLAPFLFAFVHGSAQYRFRDTIVFAIICLAVSNIFENLSILTGFPFGNYYYSDELPKLFLVPLLIGPAYLGMGYLSWTLARVIIDDTDNAYLRVVGLPLIASFVMVAWDLTFDPSASTISGTWVWRQGGAFFGVPVSNFLGWYLTVYVFFQIFALYLKLTPAARSERRKPAPGLWWPAVTMYGVTALQPLLRFWFHPSHPKTVTDPAGVIWNARDIYATGALMSLFTMTAFTLIAALKLTGPSKTAN